MNRALRWTGNAMGFSGCLILVIGLAPIAWAFGLWLSHTMPWWLWLAVGLILVGSTVEEANK